MDERQNSYILIVDDNLQNLKVLGNILKEKDYKIAVAKNGKEALNVLKNLIPDLILLDVMMPEMNGYDLCETIKKDEETCSIPIIFLTARTDTEDIVRGFTLGGVDYIRKPFNTEELLVRIENHLELKKSREIIQRQKDELMLANAAKNKIFSIISHDIRSPIASLLMTINGTLKIDFSVNEDAARKSLKLIKNSVQKAYDMIENLLLWSKFQMKGICIKPKHFYLVDIIEQNTEILVSDWQKKGLHIEVSCERNLVVFGDPEMIKIVVRNLFSNAIKFSPENEKICVSAIRSKGEVYFSISNKGKAIEPEIQEKIFRDDEFYTSIGTKGEKGTGIGLKICKSFIRAHNKSIWVKSEKDKGNTFLFTLPVEAEAL